MRKVLVGVGLVVVVAILIVANVRSSRRRGVEVDVATIGRHDLVAEVSGSGRIEARRSVDVISSVVGKVLEVAFEEGDRVERGDVILRIDPAERSALLEQASAALSSATAREELARAELRQAELELTRVRGMRDLDLGSPQALETAETTRDVRAARLAAAREDVRNAQARVNHAATELDRTVIRADIPGVIVRLAVEEGENVLAGDLYNRGSAIVTIADLSTMEAQILVDETEVVHVRPGQPATVEVDAFPDEELVGEVVEVGSSAYNAGPLGSQEAKDYRVRILLDEPPGDVRPGLSARAEIVTETREDALAVPIEALALRDARREAEKLEGPGGTDDTEGVDDAESGDEDEDSSEVEGVFLVRDGVAEFAPVETGIAGKRHFEVLSGVEEGDVVVRGPFDALRRLESGEKVRVREEKKGKGRRGKEPAEGADREDEEGE